MNFIKSFFTTVLVGGLALPSALPAAAPAPVDAAYRETFSKVNKGVRNWSVHTGHSKLRAGIADAEAFIRDYEGDAAKAKDIATVRVALVNTYCRDMDAVGAKAHAAILAASPDFDAKIVGVGALASALIEEKKDFDGALAMFEPFYADEKIHPGHYVRAVDRAAEVLIAREDRDAALAYVEKARTRFPRKLDDKGAAALDRSLDASIAKVYGAFFQPRESVAYLLKRGNDAEAFHYFANANFGSTEAEEAEGTALAKKLVETSGDLGAWAYLWRRDRDFCTKTVDRVVGTPRRIDPVLKQAERMLVQGDNLNVFGMPHFAQTKNFDGYVALYRIYEALAAEAKKPVPFAVAQYAAFAFAAKGDRAAAEKALATGLDDPKLKDEERYELKVMQVVLAATGDADAVFAAVKAAEPALAKACPEAQRVKYFQRAAGLATVMCDEPRMRGVARYYTEVIKPELPKKAYTVRFSNRRLAGAGDWANLPSQPDESDFDRQYGGSGLAFMTTDVATGDRGSAAEGGVKARKHPTTLKVVADTWGVHFLFTFYDARARQFESGELDCGSYECYLAPGANEPYFCFMSRVKQDAQATVMNTSYPTFGHRRVDPKNPTSMKSEIFFTDDAVLTYTAFSWDDFIERIPAAGSEWDFEAIFWGPVKSAWNGTATIHGRSTFGKLRFELDDAARVQIQRAQLFKAANLYRAEKSAAGSAASGLQEGCLNHWADPDIGDPAFYAAKVVPLVERLDAVAEKVKVGMSDADVRTICDENLSEFVNIRAIVARLRHDWIVEKLSAE